MSIEEQEEEEEPLLRPSSPTLQVTPPHQLSIAFAVACIVDQFGINPVIVLPRTIILCGWIGFPLAISIFALSIYTAMLLGRCWVMAQKIDHTMPTKSRYPYTALIALAWGPAAGYLANAFLNCAVFTSNIPALVIASQNIQTHLIHYPYCYWLIILGALSCPITWLGSPKDLKWISVVSTGAVFLCAVLTWVCMAWDNTRAFSYRDVPHVNWQSVFIAYGVLTFQVSCHPAILAIQTDMKDKKDLSVSVLCSFFVTGGLFMITSLLAVALYGAGVRANLTQGLPDSFTLQVTVLFITLQLFLSTIVGGSPLFQDIEDKLKIPRELCWQRCASRTMVVMTAVLLAEMLPRFDLVMSLLGAIFTGPITFIIPPLLYGKLRSMLPKPKKRPDEISEKCRTNGKSFWTSLADVFSEKIISVKKFIRNNFITLDVDEGELGPTEKTVTSIIVLIGFSATIIGIYYSLRGVVWTSQFVPPCFINVTAAASVIVR